MKKLKGLCVMLATALITIFGLVGCTMVQAQTMEQVKGTYELTSYTRTDGKTNKTTNYIEQYGYERYLVVTGSNQGYLVHKDNDTPAYSRKIFLTYTYDQEQTSKIAHLSYTLVSGSNGDDMGVTAGGLNYSKPRIYFSDLVNSDGYSYSWKKVDDATDLTYVKTKFESVREYDWGEYEVEGVYSAYGPYWENNASGVEVMPVNPYVYYLIELDPVAKQVRIAYLKTEEGSVEVREEPKPITLVNGWDEIQVGDETWVRPSGWTERYDVIRPVEGAEDGSTVRYELSRVRAGIGDAVLEEVITEKHPIGIYSLEKVEWNGATDTQTEPESPYVYYFIEINPWSETVTVTYLMKAEGSEQVVETKTVLAMSGWDTLRFTDLTWYREYDNPANFYAYGTADGGNVKYKLSRVTKEIGEDALAELIAEKTAPEVTE